MARARLLSGFLYGTLLHHRHPRGDADHDARTEDNAASDHLVDEEAQHALRDVIVRNHAVAQRADGDDIAGRTSDHLPCLLADGEHLIRITVDRHNRRLLQDNPLPLHIDEHICRPQINSYVH